MDGNGKKPRGGGKKSARPTPATDATQPKPAARAAALETPAALCDDNDAAAAQQVDVCHLDAASVDESRGAETEDNRGDDDDDDEQVERFYALLANIRAMRGLPSPRNKVASSSSFCAAPGGDTDNDTAGEDSARKKKRLRRSAEPPWRPVFRMEDFEEPAPPASSCKRTRGADNDHNRHGESSGGSAGHPVAVVASSSSMPHAAVRFQHSDSRR